jgi:serine/threonine protein kinase
VTNKTVSSSSASFMALAQLSHPGIIRAYDYGVDAAGPYYTMDLLDGLDLHDRAPLLHARCVPTPAGRLLVAGALHSRRPFTET